MFCPLERPTLTELLRVHERPYYKFVDQKLLKRTVPYSQQSPAGQLNRYNL
jgi:hypothetical protein